MFFFPKDINNQNLEEGKESDLPTLIQIYMLFCNRELFLDRKILNFFFHITFLLVSKSKLREFKFLKGEKFIYYYRLIFTFLGFSHFTVNSINKDFRMNSEKFFSNKKDLIRFFIYYKSILFNIFLRQKFVCFSFKFFFKLYFNYILYSVYYLFKYYIFNIQYLESKSTFRLNSTNLAPKLKNLEKSYLYYEILIYNQSMNGFLSKEINFFETEIPLYLFCSDRRNFKSLEDKQFSLLLNGIRQIFQVSNKKINSFDLLEKIIKRSIPLSKIIYQRRGRNLIPLMTFIYSQRVRISLALKEILIGKTNTQNLSLNSFENKVLINLLDILIANINDSFVYQSDKNSDIRKEAYSRGYFLKTLKANFKKY